MKTINENTRLTDFEFWSGAEDHSFTYEELEQIECILEDIYPSGMTNTQVNDLFWFEEEILCEWLGLEYEEYLER